MDGPAAFTISGRLHQRIGPLTARPDASQYNCVQAFFLDPLYQDTYRASRKGDSSKEKGTRDRRFEEEIFGILRRVLSQNNTYLNSFKSAMDYIKENNLDANEVRIELHATN